MKIWRLAFAMLAAFSLASCNNDYDVGKRLTSKQKEMFAQNISGEYPGQYVIVYKNKDFTNLIHPIGGIMKKVKKVHFYITIYLCISFVLLLFMASCSASKEIFNDVIVDSITDSKTGIPIFTREYDTEPYQINIVEIVKSRKAQKKKKKMEIIEKYDTHQD